jgi:DNA ligase-1
LQALASATGRKEALVKKEYETSGDLGKVAVMSRSVQRTMFKPAPLTIAGVFKTFKEIAGMSGEGRGGGGGGCGPLNIGLVE